MAQKEQSPGVINPGARPLLSDRRNVYPLRNVDPGFRPSAVAHLQDCRPRVSVCARNVAHKQHACNYAHERRA
jgi:hypothetical protein